MATAKKPAAKKAAPAKKAPAKKVAAKKASTKKKSTDDDDDDDDDLDETPKKKTASKKSASKKSKSDDDDDDDDLDIDEDDDFGKDDEDDYDIEKEFEEFDMPKSKRIAEYEFSSPASCVVIFEKLEFIKRARSPNAARRSRAIAIISGSRSKDVVRTDSKRSRIIAVCPPSPRVQSATFDSPSATTAAIYCITSRYITGV